MRLNLRKCRDKGFYIPVLILLCFVISVVIIKRRMRIQNNISEKPKFTVKQVLPTLVMACNEQPLKRSMETLTRFRPSAEIFPIIVAPYCSNSATLEVVKSFTDWDSTVTFLPEQNHTKGRPYKFTLKHLFKTLKYNAVIVLEENLDISPDFFEYFLGTYDLLKEDPSIWCVSAWNDNCKEGLVQENQYGLLHRTEFFPGNGWMVLSRTWDEIEPGVYEDSFEESLHNPAIIRGRVCIRPELSRTYNFGRSSNDPQRILNTEFVPFTRINLSYLLKKNEDVFISFAYSRVETTVKDVVMDNLNRSIKFVQIPYPNASSFVKAAKTLGLMYDFKHGVPRTGLHGIVQCYINGHRVYFTPSRKLHDHRTILNKTLSKYVKQNTNIKSSKYVLSLEQPERPRV